MKKNELLKKGIERLDDVYFWLAVLRNFDQFSESERKLIDEAYISIGEFYKKPPPRSRGIDNKDENE
jgi:hypothetical protein